MIKFKFKKLSIRKQLTLWYSLIVFLITVILFSSFYLLTRQYLIYETDRSLSIHAAQIAYNVISSTTDLHSTQTKDILSLSQREVPGIFVEIVDENGLNTDGKPSDFQHLSSLAVKNNTSEYTQQKIGDFTMRVIAYPIRNNDIIIGNIIMGHQIDVYEKTLSQLRNVGLLILLVIISPSILIGYFLARAVTSPITNLAADINKITSENLSRRVILHTNSEETEILVTNFNSLLDRLSNAFNLERQFLGEMAHEIKTPLSVIKSNSEVTLSKPRSAGEYQESIKQILSQINKLSKNMVDLMDFAWAQNIDLFKTFKKINLSQLLVEIVNIAKYMALPKHIKIESDIEGGVMVLGKEEKLYQAIYNVLDNAVKFTRENGKVTIELHSKKELVTIRIKDNGIGIDQEQQKDIFNRFYRTEQNRNIAGHGLGLAITDSIIKAHDGIIKVDSQKDMGTTITITLKRLS